MSVPRRSFSRFKNATYLTRISPFHYRTVTTLHKDSKPPKSPFKHTTSQHHCSTNTDNTDPRTLDYFSSHTPHPLHPHTHTSSPNFDPSDTRKVFQSVSTFQLLKYNLMFTLLSYPSLTNAMTQIMTATVGTGTPQTNTDNARSDNKNISQNKVSIMDIPGMDTVRVILGVFGTVLSKPLIYIVRKQYFPLFTGGETIEQCIKLSKKYLNNNIRLIIDNSTEEGHTKEVFAHNMALKKELVNVSYEKLSKSVCFTALKMTALSSPLLLEQMTEILQTYAPTDRDPTPYMSETQLSELKETLDTLTELCMYAKERGIGVWLDAEQYSRQNGMNYCSRRLMEVINRDGLYLYNTYQCYLQESHDWIAFDIGHAKDNGYQCGVKLVRGAYMDFEGEMAREKGYPNPIHKSKSDTDRAYDGAVKYVMEHIVRYYGNVGIAVCTHNRESLQNVTDLMEKFGIMRDDPFVYTAQLNGMVDNLTYSLGYTGYNSLKLIPYGSFEDVWPFLLRRFEENSDILNGSQQERSLYMQEIKRRVGIGA